MTDPILAKRLQRRKNWAPLGPGACGIGELQYGFLEMKTGRTKDAEQESAVAFIISVAEKEEDND